jgi:hypothetical protein
MFSLEPRNKLLLVEKIESKKKEERSFYVPENMSVEPRHIVVKLTGAGSESQYHSDIGSLLLVQSHLVEKVTYEIDNFYVLSESGVVGVLRKNEL